MKTLYTFNNSCKVFALAILSFLLLLTGTQYAHAQATKTFTIPGKNILVSYNELPAGQAGVVTFILTNKSDQAYVSGQSFKLTLPEQGGLRYDLSDIQKRNGMPGGVTPFAMVFNKDFSKDASFIITCNTLQSKDPLSITLSFLKQ